MIISRGGQGKTANTTSMNNHIKYRHPTLIPQLGSTNGHIPIGEMIALDNQPFVIVENSGFRNLIKNLNQNITYIC